MSLLIRFARQWIAGESLEDAIEQGKKKNKEGIGAIINFLGEHVSDITEAEKNVEENLRILRAIEDSRIIASLSIKLTQLGLVIGKDVCSSNVDRILREASLKSIFIWMDMENSPYTGDTIGIYLEAIKKYRNVGIAIQANLKRSEGDAARIAAAGGIIRLVKGAYAEKAEIAYTTRSKTTKNFSKLMAYLFYRSLFFAIATHDEMLIDEAIEVNRAHKKKVEFQFLMGVRDELKRKLVKRGFVVVDYIPYGKTWFPYTTRRLRERKRNILLVLRSVLDI